MEKSTTGPWSYKHEMLRWFTILKDGYFICRARGEANAKLIAAAPDLLEALQKADEELAANGYRETQWPRPQISAAIKKATQ
jgi:hypothetical protein